jgi:hypothetical protein
LDRATPDEIAQIVKDGGMTPERWVEMTVKDKNSFRVPGSDMRMNALARCFGVKGDPIGYTTIHLELGNQIFGSGTVISERLVAISKLVNLDRATPDEIAQIIKHGGITPERWVKMTQKERGAFRVPGSDMGMQALATRYGVKGSPVSHKAIHRELGERIFGSGTVISEQLVAISKLVNLDKVTPDEIAQIIKDGGMTPERWVEMTVKDKNSFRVPGSDMGMQGLARRFGVKGIPQHRIAIHLELGERIFGPGTLISERLAAISKLVNLDRATPDEIAQIVKDGGMTPERWVEMTVKDKNSFRVPGRDMRMNALARCFGVKGDPIGYTTIHLELGNQIFGSGTVISERLVAISKLVNLDRATSDEITQIIKDGDTTPEQWVKMSKKERLTFRVPGSDMGMTALARRFGIEGSPVNQKAIHVELGERIFGAGSLPKRRG